MHFFENLFSSFYTQNLEQLYIHFIPKLQNNFTFIKLMILNITFRLCRLLGVYYTICSFIPYVTNKILPFSYTILTILVQTRSVEQFLRYNTYFNTELKLVHYLFPLFKGYITNI